MRNACESVRPIHNEAIEIQALGEDTMKLVVIRTRVLSYGSDHSKITARFRSLCAVKKLHGFPVATVHFAEIGRSYTMVEPASASIGLYGAVQIAKDVGTQAYRVFFARSAADWHLKQLHRAELEVAYWNNHAENLQKHTGTIPEDRLKVLKANAMDFEEAAKKYDKRVKRWCKRLSVAITDNAASTRAEDTSTLWISSEESLFDVEDKDTPENEEKKHRINFQGRKISLIGRFGFVLYGEYLIKKQAQEVAELRQLLSIKCVAESSLATSVPISSGVPATRRESKLMQFIARALERVRTNAPIKVFRIFVPDAQYKYTDGDLLDPRMEDFAIPEYALPRVSLTPLPHAAEQGLEPVEHCIVIRRSTLLAISEENYESEAAKIARLFAEDEEHSKGFLVNRSDGDVLRCCGVVLYPGQGCDLLFKLPPGSNPFPRTLRQLLTDPRSSRPVHPLSDRIKFSIRIVANLLVVHSLGLVHKRVHPETIVVVEPLAMVETDVFPYRLGHPYLTSLQLARTDNGKTKKLRYQAAITHRAPYIHPRDQYTEPCPGHQAEPPTDGFLVPQEISDRRLDEFRPRDDIFSAGVCLFEVICFRSLLIWKEKPEVQYPDYVYDDEFVPLSDNLNAWKGLTPGERAKRKAGVLIEHVKDKIPKTLGRRMGKRVVDIIVSFLRAGYEDEAFGVSLRDKSDAELSLFFLSQALQCLRDIHKEMIESENK